MGRERFFIDPDMTDQEILDMIEEIKIKKTPEVEAGEIPLFEETAAHEEERP